MCPTSVCSFVPPVAAASEDDSCDMCSGGWPQNAYEWAMDHGGLPLYQSFPYDGSTLLEMTAGIEGTSDNWE